MSPIDVVPGLICSVWYAQGGDYYDAQVDGSDEPGTTVVTYLEADEQVFSLWHFPTSKNSV